MMVSHIVFTAKIDKLVYLPPVKTFISFHLPDLRSWQDYAINLCGALDILNLVISWMLKTQAVNIPYGKTVTKRVSKILVLKET